MEAPGIEASDREQSHAESCGVSREEAGTSVPAPFEANSVSMGVAASRCSSEVAGARRQPGAADGALLSPRLAVVEVLARAAVAALVRGDVVGARAVARALVEFIEAVAVAG